MSAPENNLIFDRAEIDVEDLQEFKELIESGSATSEEESEWEAARSRGAWNYTDLNRIEEWTEYLAGQLAANGYSVTVNTKTNWTNADFPTQTEVDRIRANVEALQDGFYSLLDWQEIVYNNTMNFGQANALEWDLQCIYTWLQRMVQTLDSGWTLGIAYTGLYAKEGDYV